VLVGAVPVSGRDVVTISLGANVTDRQDFGEHDDEEGSGAGLGVGYRRFAGEQLDGWFYNARVDLWALSIDWRDEPGARGTSDVLVLQPSVEGGYGFRLGARWRLAPSSLRRAWSSTSTPAARTWARAGSGCWGCRACTASSSIGVMQPVRTSSRPACARHGALAPPSAAVDTRRRRALWRARAHSGSCPDKLHHTCQPASSSCPRGVTSRI
jgi:hypothetical protein